MNDVWQKKKNVVQCYANFTDCAKDWDESAMVSTHNMHKNMPSLTASLWYCSISTFLKTTKTIWRELFQECFWLSIFKKSIVKATTMLTGIKLLEGISWHRTGFNEIGCISFVVCCMFAVLWWVKVTYFTDISTGSVHVNTTFFNFWDWSREVLKCLLLKHNFLKSTATEIALSRRTFTSFRKMLPKQDIKHKR